MIAITVYGTPAPQGSKRFLGLKSGKGILVESSKAVKPWREAVKFAAIAATAGMGLSGPVVVVMTFTVPKPKSAPKKRRTWPDRKPDLSKLVRSTEDALTDAGVFEDDARIVMCISRKTYPRGMSKALAVPGAFIEVYGVEEWIAASEHSE